MPATFPLFGSLHTDFLLSLLLLYIISPFAPSQKTAKIVDLILLQSKLGKHLINTEDSVRFYPLCVNCVEKVETIGDPPPKEEILFIV